MWVHYTELTVWKKAMELTDEIYRLTGCLPVCEQYALASQMRRAAVSVPSNIAEGHGRGSAKDFQRFLFIARGSAFELETQLQISVRQHYLTDTQISDALELCKLVQKMLFSLARTVFE